MLSETKESLSFEKMAFFCPSFDKGLPLNFSNLFNNENPVFLEIGCGKGEFITQFALLHPEINLLGFELQQKRIHLILRKLNLNLHFNVRILNVKIDEYISSIIRPKSVNGVYIQHPDPWPKRRHFRRRLIQSSFITSLSLILHKGGFVQISTDHVGYAEWIHKLFSTRNDFREATKEEINDNPLLNKHIETYYETEQKKHGFESIELIYFKSDNIIEVDNETYVK